MAVTISPIVLSLLWLLARNAGKIVSKAQITRHVWDGRPVSNNAITVSISRLRKVLGHEAGVREFVNNVHRRGYRFVPPVTQRAAAAKAESSFPAVVPSAPYVGREKVLAMLREALQQAQNGRGNLCVLVGEAGIGKTSAVESLARKAVNAGVPVIWSHCRHACDTPPLWPFAELVRGMIEACEIELASPRVSPLLPALGWLLPEFGRSDARAGEHLTTARKHALFDAITRLLGLFGEKPRVLVLDDLHRADGASLELLQYCLDELSHTRVLLIATVRTVGVEPERESSLTRIMGHRSCRWLSLWRLSEADVARYLEWRVPKSTSAQVHAVFEKSEGIPFFMCELARELAHTGHVLRLPSVVRGPLEQRIAALDGNALEVVARAAVIGRRFDLWLLQSVIQLGASQVMESLDSARSLGVIRLVDCKSTEFLFDHELLREVLQDSLPRSERRRCHLRAAEALEHRTFAGETIAQAELANHLHAAMPDGDLRKTVAACLDAAREATASLLYADALQHVRQAREALDLIENVGGRCRVALLTWEALLARVCSDPRAESLACAALRLLRAQWNAPTFAAARSPNLNAGVPSWPDACEALEEALGLLPSDEVGMRSAVRSRLAMLASIAFACLDNSENCEPPRCAQSR